MSLHMMFEPFIKYGHDVLESLSLIVTVMTMLGSLVYAVSGGNKNGLISSDVLGFIVTAVLVMLNGVLFVSMVSIGVTQKLVKFGVIKAPRLAVCKRVVARFKSRVGGKKRKGDGFDKVAVVPEILECDDERDTNEILDALKCQNALKDTTCSVGGRIGDDALTLK